MINKKQKHRIIISTTREDLDKFWNDDLKHILLGLGLARHSYMCCQEFEQFEGYTEEDLTYVFYEKMEYYRENAYYFRYAVIGAKSGDTAQ